LKQQKAGSKEPAFIRLWIGSSRFPDDSFRRLHEAFAESRIEGLKLKRDVLPGLAAR